MGSAQDCVRIANGVGDRFKINHAVLVKMTASEGAKDGSKITEKKCSPISSSNLPSTKGRLRAHSVQNI